MLADEKKKFIGKEGKALEKEIQLLPMSRKKGGAERPQSYGRITKVT